MLRKMPDKNDKLKGELYREFENLCASVRKAESEGLEIPSSLTDALNLAKSQYDVANKKFSDGNKEEALGEMQEAVNSANAVSYEVEKLYFMKRFKETCKVRASFKGHEDLAYKYMPNYVLYSYNFREITNLVERYKPSDKKPQRGEIYGRRCQLQDFLEEYGVYEEELVAAINKEKRANRFKWINIIAIVAAAIFGTAIGSLLTYLLCKPAQTESTVSGAELQSAANNSTP